MDNEHSQHSNLNADSQRKPDSYHRCHLPASEETPIFVKRERCLSAARSSFGKSCRGPDLALRSEACGGYKLLLQVHREVLL